MTLPRLEDPIESGLQPETGGTFTVFNYPNYLDKKVFKEFGKKYKVTAVSRHSTTWISRSRGWPGTCTADVMEMTPDNLDQVVAGKLIKPVNLDYIPNLKKNVWPQL